MKPPVSWIVIALFALLALFLWLSTTPKSHERTLDQIGIAPEEAVGE